MKPDASKQNFKRCKRTKGRKHLADFYFTSKGHKERFLANMRSLGKIYNGKLDQEYGACLYILTSHADIWQKARTYVHEEGIDIPGMLEYVDLSGGQSVLVKLAGNLFNDETHCDAIELMRLDSENFTVALQALEFRRVAWTLAEVAH
jgi:hypothetical protein